MKGKVRPCAPSKHPYLGMRGRGVALESSSILRCEIGRCETGCWTHGGLYGSAQVATRREHGISRPIFVHEFRGERPQRQRCSAMACDQVRATTDDLALVQREGAFRGVRRSASSAVPLMGIEGRNPGLWSTSRSPRDPHARPICRPPEPSRTGDRPENSSMLSGRQGVGLVGRRSRG